VARHAVLIVAQNADLRAVLAHRVRAAGYSSELAESSKRVREITDGARVDLAIVAPGEFGSSGFELAQDLRDSVGQVVLLAKNDDEARRYSRAMPECIVLRASALDEPQ
jgi:DNA-binding response OmpR family regulator